MKRRRLIVAAIVIVIAIALLVINGMRNHRDDASMALSGNVEITETNVGFKISGRITKLLVDEGATVKAGDAIAELDNAELASLMAQNKASMEETVTRLSELKAGVRNQELEQAKASVGAQEAELKKVRQDYERADTLYKNGAISQAQYDDAKSAFDTRMALRKSAVEALSLAQEGTRKEEIKIAEHRVAQAKATLSASEVRFRDAVIYAPIDGVVLRKNVEVGETVAQGTPVFTIGDLKSPWIKVYVKEDRLALVKLGQKAIVTVDSYKGKTYEGVVSYISSEAEFTPKTVQTPEERVKLVFGVKVQVKNEAGDLKPSMPADVKILLK
ncbi:MAG TPA: efflux RND transporter periplasmic adaptor subunit [Syntrophorhabdaceae bacterium]|nr:efflux RND transporter periplasmic adaptor subunit [Syntrophorhabdaceae bacterium]